MGKLRFKATKLKGASLIFKNGDRNIPSNYRTIMISRILAKLYGIILEKKISLWLESYGNRAKGQVGFRRYHSTLDHIVTFRIIAEELHNTKTNFFCCFVDFRKAFDPIPMKNLWNRLEEIKVSFELRALAIRLYENIIVEFKNTKGWLKDINCNIGVKQGCPLSPTLFNIYFDKLENYIFINKCNIKNKIYRFLNLKYFHLNNLDFIQLHKSYFILHNTLFDVTYYIFNIILFIHLIYYIIHYLM
jgi:hypothetical protein